MMCWGYSGFNTIDDVKRTSCRFHQQPATLHKSAYQSMTRRLNWIDVLNEQPKWRARTDLVNWFSELIGRPAALKDGAVEGFEEALGFMRRQMANLHFSEPVDLIWLDAQLKTVNLGLLHHQGAQEGINGRLPLFRARVKGLLDSDLLRSVKDTLLVQFAEFTATSLAEGEPLSVHRCQGLEKTSSTDSRAAAAWYPVQTEMRWLAEIPLAAGLPQKDRDSVRRCLMLFPSISQTDFCSHICCTSSYEIGKQAQEPAVVTEKQRRYRKKQEK